jgi:transaldolase / glucose-6-phosphate isomerase
VDARDRLTRMDAVERLATHDATLFADPALAATRLGWTTMARDAVAQADGFAGIAAATVAAGITDVVLLGMGGSSLAALVLSRSIAGAVGYPTLHVLDTTSPDQVGALIDALDPVSTLVVVSSKSGTTVEPLSLLAVFRDRMAEALGDAAPSHFIAITDPGSPLETLAVDAGFARAVPGPADVGGRYAALAPFAMLPAALAGLDVAAIAATAQVLEDACSRPGEDNPALALAAWMADSYDEGRDKLTIVCSDTLAGFGLWAEQLVAESTGKDGRGLLPVIETSPGLPGAHGPDRMTFVLRAEGDDALAGLSARLPEGEPVFEVVIDDAYAIAAEFVHWVWAIALFSAVSGIEPFGQPDVERSKVASRAILGGDAPALDMSVVEGGVRLAASTGIPVTALDDAVAALLGRIGDGGYLAVLAYLPEDEALLSPLRGICAEVSLARTVPATFELGPRYLHSTGQFHKGGPSGGAYLVIGVECARDIPVPGQPFTLAGLNAAQWAGDATALLGGGRPVLAIGLPSTAALEHVVRALASAVRA